MTFRKGLMLFTACSGAVGGLSLAAALAQTAPQTAAAPNAAVAQPLSGNNSQVRLAQAYPANDTPFADPAPSANAQGSATGKDGGLGKAPVRLAQAAPSNRNTPIRNSPVGRGSGAGAVPGVNTAPGGGVGPSSAVSSSPTGGGSADEPIADVVIKKRELLLKQKDVPSGITEIGKRDIQVVGETGSVQSLLQQSAPSVNVYQQGLGQDVPVISVRGVRGADLATTLDGIPTQDLLNGGSGSFLANNIGAPFDINQIGGVTVEPGIAPPGTQGYGTIGGTLAYNSKRPTDERYYDFFGGIGSFGTDHYGAEFNSGAIKQLDNLKLLLRYDRGESAGYIDYTQSKYRDIYFAADKPYSNGLSNVGLTVIANQASGYLQPSPAPVTSLNTYGEFYNYDKSQSSFRQDNQFFTTILRDETYVNDYIKIGGSAFYLGAFNKSQSYVSPNIIGANQNFQPNFQVPFFAYGQLGPGTIYQNSQYFNYNPGIFGNPSGLTNGVPGNSPQGFGENAEQIFQTSNTYGIKPEVDFFLPYNNIRVGALVAREQQNNQSYVYGQLPVPAQPGYNEFALNNAQRQLYEGYIQDRIDLFNNTLHIEPGFTYEGVLGQLQQPFSYVNSGLYNGGYTLNRWDVQALPYVGASYDLPGPLKNASVYGSWGRSALYAPISDYALSSTGGTAASGPERLTAVEAGFKYNTDRLYLNVDYFNQEVQRAFSFYANYLTQQFSFANQGIEEFKGFEGSFKYKLTPEIGLFGSASHLLAKYLQSYAAFTTIFEDQFGYGFKGSPISGVPDYTASFGVDYDKKNLFKAGDESYIRFYGVYTGQQYTTYDISPASAQAIANPQLAAATVTNQGFKLSAYAIFNLGVHYSLPVERLPIKKIDFQFNVQNLFNQHYYAYYYNQYVSYAGVYGGAPYSSAVPGAPTVVVLDVSARF